MRLRFLLLLFPLPLLLFGCGHSDPMSPSIGADVGGAQDIGYARSLIESGGVPDADFIVPEGLYSEHDIASPAGECADRLCLALGYGYAPVVDDGGEDLFVHLGFTSTISADEFQRPHLQLALVIDRSGSMGGESMAAVKDALHTLVDRLDDDDEVMMVIFDNYAEISLEPRRMDAAGRNELRRAIDLIEVRGGTNIEAGLAIGYERLATLGPRAETSKRVMLFTDAMPNIGSTDKESFAGMTTRYAESSIGLSAFGVGVDFGQELIYHIAQLRGGNFFYLQNAERIREIFVNEFEYLVTPIAYDLTVRIETPPGARLKSVYGLPTWKPGDPEAVLEIPTVFLSSKRGAIMLRYETTGGGDYAIGSGEKVTTGDITYIDPFGAGTVVNQREMRHNGNALLSGDRYFSHDGTRLGVALTNVYLALHLGCAAYHDKRVVDGLAILQRGIDFARQENIELRNTGLDAEIAMMEKLHANMEAGG